MKNENAAGILGVCWGSGADIVITNCYNTGEIAGGRECATISGWVGDRAVITNCWNTGTITSGADTGKPFCRFNGAKFEDCWDVQGIQANIGVIAEADLAGLATGEFCYKVLNKTLSENVAWYQEVNVDEHPYPIASHGTVYAVGELNCDGTSKSGSAVYSNDNTSKRDPHNFVNGACSHCDEFDPNYMTADADGFFNLATGADLYWFARYVNMDGNNAANARLTADIVYDKQQRIGVQERYMGIFDGQGHKLTVAFNGDLDAIAMFAKLENATVQNLIIGGTITSTRQYVGGIASEAWSNTTIKNCIVAADITSTFNGDGTHGGIIAIGHNNLVIENCAFVGTFNASNSLGSGGIMGYKHEPGDGVIKNCYISGQLGFKTGGNSNNVRIARNAKSIENCWVSNINIVYSNHVNTKTFDPALVSTGELCYLMNNESVDNSLWRQTLTTEGGDAYPVPFASSGIVYANGKIDCGYHVIEGGYSNTNNTFEKIHDKGIYGICHCQQECDQPEQKDGVYQIKNAGNLVAFSKLVADGTAEAQAVLLNDIDLEGVAFSPIGKRAGDGGVPYKGVFDGKGFRIKNMVIDVIDKNQGLFGCITGGATIKNVIIDKSSLVMTSGDYNGQAAGLVGCAEGSGDILIERCGNEAYINCASANGAGIIACVYSGEIYLTIKDCYNTGNIKGTHETSTLSGWLGNNATVTNCWNSGSIEWGQDGDKALFRGNATVTNCYNTINNGNNSTQITAEQIASGELAFKLGNKVWYQTLGEGGDAHPVFDATHGVVGQENGSVYANSATINPGEDLYATYYNSTVAYVMPEGCEGYVAYYDESNVWNFEKVYDGGQVVPAGVALVIKADVDAAKTLAYTAEEGTAPAKTALDGTDTDTALEADDTSFFYAVAYAEGGGVETIGFYWMAADGAAFTNAANKAYLKVAKDVFPSSAKISGFAFGGDGEATGINSVNSAEADGAVYNLAGQRVLPTTKGIVIKNGRKYFNK